jgi:hypothetical protein
MADCEFARQLRRLLGIPALIAFMAAPASAQNAEELRRIWNDPTLLDRQPQPAPDERPRPATDQVARQRAAVEAEQRAVLSLPEEERRRIQQSLTILGLYGGPTDGNLASPATVKAAGDWQKAKARPQTGKLTPPEVKLLHEEATKAATKERLDSGAGIAARKSEAGRIVPSELADRLFDGARDDVLVLLNETPSARNVTRPGGTPVFKDKQALGCAPFAWNVAGDFAAYIRDELGRLGAERLQPDPLRPCNEPRQPVDLVLLERRHLFEQGPEKLKPLLEELRDRKLTLLAVIPHAAFVENRDKQQAEKRRLEAARRASDEKKVQSAAARGVDEPMKRRQASEPKAQAMASALVDRLRAYIDGESLEEGFAEFRRWHESRKDEGRTIGEIRTAIDDFGSGSFQARTLDAIAVEVYFELRERSGSQTDCLVFAWLEEAPIRRAPAVFACDRVAALEQWKSDNAFRSQWR